MGIIAVIAIATFAGYNVHVSLNKEVKLSELALANVEALAQSESGGGEKCSVIGYQNIWSGGCLFYCAQCAEGYFKMMYLKKFLKKNMK